MNQTPTTNFVPFADQQLLELRDNWRSCKNIDITPSEFILSVDRWFKSTKLNNLNGWDNFDQIDYTLGCAHFIDSTAAKYKWNIQVLPLEYATYKLMGIQQTLPGELVPGIPFFITVPNWHFGGIRPEWDDIMQECEDKGIAVHIDFAWFITAKNISLNLNYDCIKSFGMSFSKYNMSWNRCGLRWSKQRTLDSITIENHYYQNSNLNTLSAGMFFIENIPMDYLWNTYGELNQLACNRYNLSSTDIFHVAIDNETGNKVGIGNILTDLAR